MENRKKYLILGSLVIVLIAAIIVMTSMKKSTDNNLENLNTESQGTVANETVSEEQAAPTPVYTKKVELEIMNPEEKEKMGFAPEEMIQVLERDASGTVLAYRVMKSEEDVMEYYGN